MSAPTVLGVAVSSGESSTLGRMTPVLIVGAPLTSFEEEISVRLHNLPAWVTSSTAGRHDRRVGVRPSERGDRR